MLKFMFKFSDSWNCQYFLFKFWVTKQCIFKTLSISLSNEKLWFIKDKSFLDSIKTILLSSVSLGTHYNLVSFVCLYPKAIS